ncbi:MAG: DUF2279 domain-containing protein [Cryomorphaceae bacterium]|nr:DUF2279 domain-containing protein [Cryomorphaceae bacterium]
MAAKTRYSSVIGLCLIALLASGQTRWDNLLTPSDTLNSVRLRNTILIESTLATATLSGLYVLWYADYPQSSFHFVNDNRDWLQMDKFGHAMSAYYVGVKGIELMKWTGMEKKKALWYGGLQGWAFLLAVEVFDGFSEQWGFSPGDFYANTLGAGLAIGQEALWDEQRILMKFSFSGSPYRKENPNVLGTSLWQSWLKDYNGQTYWLSASPGQFMQNSKWPEWLCVSVGHSGMGMATGDPNNQVANSSYNHLHRQRQYLFSLDIDLTKIHVRNRFWRNVLHTINFIKIPMPTFEVQQNGNTQWHWMYF